MKPLGAGMAARYRMGEGKAPPKGKGLLSSFIQHNARQQKQAKALQR